MPVRHAGDALRGFPLRGVALRAAFPLRGAFFVVPIARR